LFTKNEENLCAKHLEGAPTKGGGARQVPPSPPHKHTSGRRVDAEVKFYKYRFLILFFRGV